MWLPTAIERFIIASPDRDDATAAAQARQDAAVLTDAADEMERLDVTGPR